MMRLFASHQALSGTRWEPLCAEAIIARRVPHHRPVRHIVIRRRDPKARLPRLLPERIARSIGAGIFAAAKSLAVFALVLAISVVALHAGLRWYASGTFSLIPTSPASAGQQQAIEVRDATPEQDAAIRSAVEDLRYRFPPRALTISVVEQLPIPGSGATYQSGFGLVQVSRGIVDENGATLRHALAHEIGHYVDERYLDDAQRRQFMRMRRIPSDLSWTASTSPWQKRPNEDFAEVFAILDVASPERPPNTAYGRLRRPAAYRRLLEDAGVSFGRVQPKANWRALAEQELSFARSTLSTPVSRVLILALAAIYLVSGVVPAVQDAWRQR